MTKIISASTILKQKGFVQKKFDTSGFMNAVAQYFIKNKISSHLYLIEHSFVDCPDCDSEEELPEAYKRFSWFHVFNADKEKYSKPSCESFPSASLIIPDGVVVLDFDEDNILKDNLINVMRVDNIDLYIFDRFGKI